MHSHYSFAIQMVMSRPFCEKVNPPVPIHIHSWTRCTALSEMTLQTNVEQMFAFDRNVLIKATAVF